MVSILIKADALVLLSDVPGIYDMPPTNPEAKLITHVPFDMDFGNMEIGGTNTGVGTGGAITKVAAARSCTEAGIAVVVTHADAVGQVLSGENVGSYFEPRPQIGKSQD
jgi:glutamate 5-kinase